jgi:hypothetical protein
MFAAPLLIFPSSLEICRNQRHVRINAVTWSSQPIGDDMNLIYNSEQYSVMEFGADNDGGALHSGGYEITDKPSKREAFIGGALAESFRQHVRELIAREPSMEEIDDFLGSYDALMNQPVVFH